MDRRAALFGLAQSTVSERLAKEPLKTEGNLGAAIDGEADEADAE